MTSISNLFPSPYQIPKYTNYSQEDKIPIEAYQWEVTNKRDKKTDGPIYFYNNNANTNDIMNYAFEKLSPKEDNLPCYNWSFMSSIQIKWNNQKKLWEVLSPGVLFPAQPACPILDNCGGYPIRLC